MTRHLSSDEEQIRARAKQLGLDNEPSIERAIVAWLHAEREQTAEAYAVAADAFEEAGAFVVARAARWLAASSEAP